MINANTIFLLVMIGVFYLLVVRPQQRRAREHREMLAALSVGDEVITIGGIFGTVDEIGERIRLSTVDGSRMEVSAQAIGQVVGPGDSDEDVHGGSATEPAGHSEETD